MSINIIERAIVPYNETGSSVIFNNQYHMFAPVAGINKVGMAGYNDDFSISTSQIVSISDKFKASGLQYTDVSNLPANIVYAIDGIKSPNVVFSGYEHAVQDPTPGNTGNITVKGSLLTTYSNYTDTDNYSMNEILFADGRIWLRELNIVAGVVDSMTAFKISYSKDEVDSYFRTKGDSYTITQINALLDLKVSLAGAETITGKKTFSAGLDTSVVPTSGPDIVNKNYADLKVAKAGTETITGKKTFSAGLDTPVPPAAGHDVVNKTYADSKVPKSAIKVSVSGTPLDSNVLSEKFVNTTYRTKADSWSKADLDAHIGALETRVGNEVLSASLPGNEFGQGTLSGIINTLGSHIDSLQLGFVPRTMRNVITPLRSKNPTDLSTTDSYDELIALSEAGFVPDIPVGQTMTLVDRLNAFILADQGRVANHTDAVVCVDIQAPDRGRLITYYYWDLGSGDEYEGVPAGWYVADVNMSPDNLTSIGAFTNLLSKTPVGYEEDSTGTRVFAVNGSWKKYSAADLHAIYPTLEYLGLLNLWFIILAPDVDTMNTINNYEPGKSVALVDSSHGMGIDSAISIELLKKVKDVESGSLIQNTQYCSLNQYHVLSNGLVVLYTDDPFDGEVVIKTGKAYYVSGATEMMAVPMSQVTGLELALDSKANHADIIGESATAKVKFADIASAYDINDANDGSIARAFDYVYHSISGKQPTGNYATLDDDGKVNEVAKSADVAEMANKYNQDDDTEGSINSKFNSVDSAVGGKVDKADGYVLTKNDLTDTLKGNYDAAYTHSQAAHAPSNAEANVQSDWSEEITTSDAYIKNKPTSMNPSAHKDTHKTTGSDALTPSDIGAAAASHSHSGYALEYISLTDIDATFDATTPLNTIFASMADNSSARFYTSGAAKPPTATGGLLEINKVSSSRAVAHFYSDHGFSYENMYRGAMSGWTGWSVVYTEFSDYEFEEVWSPITYGTNVGGFLGCLEFYMQSSDSYLYFRIFRPSTNSQIYTCARSNSVTIYYSGKYGSLSYWIDNDNNTLQVSFIPFDGSSTLYPTFAGKGRWVKYGYNRTMT